nr:hypothetical protein [Tanacetum cinerariifolium]
PKDLSIQCDKRVT